MGLERQGDYPKVTQLGGDRAGIDLSDSNLSLLNPHICHLKLLAHEPNADDLLCLHGVFIKLGFVISI